MATLFSTQEPIDLPFIAQFVSQATTLPVVILCHAPLPHHPVPGPGQGDSFFDLMYCRSSPPPRLAHDHKLHEHPNPNHHHDHAQPSALHIQGSRRKVPPPPVCSRKPSCASSPNCYPPAMWLIGQEQKPKPPGQHTKEPTVYIRAGVPEGAALPLPPAPIELPLMRQGAGFLFLQLPL